MKKIGIWLDKKTAFLVTLGDTETSIEDKAASFEKVDSIWNFIIRREDPGLKPGGALNR